MFSDTSFETMSKHSNFDVVSMDNDKVVYSEIIKDKSEDSEDEEMIVIGEKDVEEKKLEEEDSVSSRQSNTVQYHLKT